MSCLRVYGLALQPVTGDGFIWATASLLSPVSSATIPMIIFLFCKIVFTISKIIFPFL